MQRNLPDISHALSLNPSWSTSTPLHDGRSNDFTFEKNPLREAQGIQKYRNASPERLELRELCKTLGGAMEWALDTLLSETGTSQELTQDRRIEAFQCLQHVKDILIKEGKADIDIRRLLDPILRSNRKDASKHSSFSSPTSKMTNVFSRTLSTSPPQTIVPQSHLERQVSTSAIPSDPLGVLP